jgi:hypothetical protein
VSKPSTAQHDSGIELPQLRWVPVCCHLASLLPARMRLPASLPIPSALPSLLTAAHPAQAWSAPGRQGCPSARGRHCFQHQRTWQSWSCCSGGARAQQQRPAQAERGCGGMCVSAGCAHLDTRQPPPPVSPAFPPPLFPSHPHPPRATVAQVSPLSPSLLLHPPGARLPAAGGQRRRGRAAPPPAYTAAEHRHLARLACHLALPRRMNRRHLREPFASSAVAASPLFMPKHHHHHPPGTHHPAGASVAVLC